MWKKIKDMFEKFIGKIMENKYMIFLKYLLSEFISWAKTSEGVIFIVAWATIAYVIYTFNTQIMYWYNDNIIPFLSIIVSNILLSLIALFLVIVALYDIIKKISDRYQFDKYLISALLFISGILIYFRYFTEDYYYVYWINCVSYVDLIWITSVAYSLIAVFNKIIKYRIKFKKNHENIPPKEDKSLLFDGAIDNIEEDIFDFKDDIKEVVEEIKELDSNKTWSFAINAPWGTGKTSFINLIEDKIKKEADFEIIKFNPRNSKSASHIQEDYFNTLASALSKYDSSFSHNIKAYMESLQLIDESGIVKKIVDFYHIWNKKSLKKTIKESFASLKKRVLVVIDDFDRLTQQEIFEVLKLIDSNAAFPNIIFLTAYDKKQVDKLLGDSYKSNDACFIDKFFNVEYHIPLRSYSYISGYIVDKLSKRFIDDKNDIEKAINAPAISEEFSKYIPTLRDAKRYINQFMFDYKYVNGDVIVKEFLLVQLIKYRYYELYKKTYNKEFTEPNRSNFNLISLKEKLVKDDKKHKPIIILSILKELFNNIPITTDQTDFEQAYRHIYTKEAFDNYFVNKIFSSLRTKDMKILFSQGWVDITRKIDEWSNNIEKINDFISYLHSIYSDRNEGNILIYTKILVYTACKTPYSWVYKLFMKNIRISELNGMNFNKGLLDDIKNTVRDLILNKEYDPKLDLAQRMHFDYVLEDYNKQDYLLNDDDIWPNVKKTFISSLGSSKDEEYIFNNLCRCAESMEPNSRKINLDKDCTAAYRKHIETYPNWYIQNFVGLGMKSSSPDWNTVACRAFWRQIFGGETQFEKYLEECKAKNIKGLDRVLNFWRLYEANGYEPIEFDNQGNVQEKINNDLVGECRLLDKLLKIQKEANNMSKNIKMNKKKWNINKKRRVIERLNKNLNKLNNVKLYIKLNGDISQEINRNINILEDEIRWSLSVK